MVHPHAIVGILRRLVQLDGAATAEDGHLAEDDPQQQDSTSESTLGLRVLAIFMILAAGLLGALPPLFLRTFRDPGSIPRVLLRALAAGIIISLALIHIIPDGMEQIHDLALTLHPAYPDCGGAVVSFGLVFMITLEAVTYALLSRTLARSTANAETDASNHHQQHLAVAVLDVDKSGGGCGGDKSGDLEACDFKAPAVTLLSADKAAAHQLTQPPTACLPAPHVHVCHHHNHLPQVYNHHHNHHADSAPTTSGANHLNTQPPCIATSTADALPIVAAAPLHPSLSLRQQVMAYMFELGCIFHSVVIGLALGVETEDRGTVIATLITLTVHQLLEGAALSSFIIDASVGMAKGVTMIVLYALTCPVGVAIGVGVSSTYDESTTTAMAVQGTFNCLSGGMLLYIGLVQIVAVDFTHGGMSTQAHHRPWVKVAAHVCLAFGVAAMALVALGEALEGGDDE